MLFDVIFVEFEHLVHVRDCLGILSLEIDEHHADPLSSLDRFFHDQVKQHAGILPTRERQVHALDAVERLRNPAPSGSQHVVSPISFDCHQ